MTTPRRDAPMVIFGMQLPRNPTFYMLFAVIGIVFAAGMQWALFSNRNATVDALAGLPAQVANLEDRVAGLETKTEGLPDLILQVNSLTTSVAVLPGLQRDISELLTRNAIVSPLRDQFQSTVTTAIQNIQQALSGLAADMASVKTAVAILVPTRARGGVPEVVGE